LQPASIIPNKNAAVVLEKWGIDNRLDSLKDSRNTAACPIKEGITPDIYPHEILFSIEIIQLESMSLIEK
jgi:hypothetical protein